MPAKKKSARKFPSKSSAKKKSVVSQARLPSRFQCYISWRWIVISVIILFAIAVYLLLSTSQNMLFTNAVSGQIFSGKVSKLNTDLHLVERLDTSVFAPNTTTNVYYSAGTYLSGVYKGYRRIILLVDTNTPIGVVSYTFATFDSKTFVIDAASKKHMELDGIFQTAKNVTDTVTLPTEQPQILALDPNFSLYRESVAYTNQPTGKKDQHGNMLTTPVLTTTFPDSTFTSLFSPFDTLHIVAKKGDDAFDYLKQIPNATLPNAYGLFQKYIAGTTLVYVTDSTGFTYTYSLSNQQNIASHEKVFGAYQDAVAAYNLTLQKPQNPGSIPPQYPALPQGVYEANLHLYKGQITSNQPLFSEYSVAMPHTCGQDPSTIVAQNITNQDLTPIGSASGYQLFVLKDSHHPLYQLAYFIKISSFPSLYWQNENSLPRPTYEQYVAQHPLLFLKDYWGRWIVLGEYDYQLQGGCGKPVMYFYPTKPTAIHVAFTQPMQLTKSIPHYASGWDFLAEPDGSLHDLQQAATSCNQFAHATTDATYALKACQKNNYPYIYWAGQSFASSYPVQKEGWVVKKSELAAFLSQKLLEVGFTQKEMTDMTSYWIPQMLLKNAAYYRVSFLQTKDMDKLVPLSIQPTPDNTFRLFLDWSPVQTFFSLPPEQLGHVVRKGFTFVEWGGLQE